MSKKINIRPTTSVYATYKNIKYDPWTAIAEFVDNSTQSFYDNIQKLENTKYWEGLNVEIQYNRDEKKGDSLIIKDNAYGMNFNDFQRAIMLDSPPKKPTRSEFGMGLKTAACWFGTKWCVESVELGSGIKYRTEVDVDMLHKYKNEEVTVEEIPCNSKEHGTTITIWNLNRTITGRQVKKTKDQLRGMYRVDLRTKKINISYNGEKLFYDTPKVLCEEMPDGTKVTWKKDINFEINHLEKNYHVNGFVGILEEGSTSGAGFTLIRRGRVIVGGYENGYRPEEVFDKQNSFAYQRLFGELNMDDWPVTQTKDAFDWYSGLEDILIEKLLENCKDYKKKANEYRKRKKIILEPTIEKLVDSFTNAGIIENVQISSIDSSDNNQLFISDNNIEYKNGEEEDEIQIEGDNGSKIIFTCGQNRYVFNYYLKRNDPDSQWLGITKNQSNDDEYIIEWNIRHPFFKPYIDDPEFLKIMEYFTFALALSEIEARVTSVDGKADPGIIRIKMNETLRTVLNGNKDE